MSDKLNNIFIKWLATVEAKIFTTMAFIAALISLVIFIYIPSQLDIVASDIIDNETSHITIMASQSIGPAIDHNDQEAIEKAVKSLKDHWHLVYAVLQDNSGNLLYSYNMKKATSSNYLQLDNPSSNLQRLSVYSFSSPIVADNRHVGILYLGLSTDAILDQLNKFGNNAAGLGIIFILLALLATIIIRNIVINPVKRLQEGIERIAAGDEQYRYEYDFGGEFGKLADSFNKMVEAWQASLQQWGMLNKDLEQRVDERTQALKDEISERKKAEEDLRLFMTKLERSNRELEDFAFVASHDLQEPLRKVQAFGDRLKAVCGDELSEKARNYLERMQAAAGRMQVLIKDLLTFSRVASKAQPFITVDLNKITEEVLSDLEVTIENLGAKIEVADLREIEADPLQMRQLIQNLIGNALKFHKKDQTPMVNIYGETFKGRRSGDGPAQEVFNIAIEDNGIGFDQKYAERIFTVFQRLHGRSEYEGTGLGLAVCRKIVERHGGTIAALSEPDKGAKFLISLPVYQNPREELTRAGAQEKQASENKQEVKDPKKKIEGMETSFMVPCP